MCAEGVLKLWSANTSEEGFVVKSELMFGRNLQEVTALHELKSSQEGQDGDLMLLTGGYDSKIHVYVTKGGSAPSELQY